MLVDWSKGSRNPQFALSCLVWLSFFSLFATEGLQFFQYFTHSFLQAQLPKVQKDTDDLTVFLRLWDLCELKLLANMLVKSTQGLQFLHYFTHSFLRGQLPKVQKDTDDLTVSLRFWDLCALKLLANMLVKLTQGLNFINILLASFSYEHCFGSFFNVHVTRKSCLNDVCTKNACV